MATSTLTTSERSRRRGCRLRRGSSIQQIQLQVARLAPWHAHDRHRADAVGRTVVPALSEPPCPASLHPGASRMALRSPRSIGRGSLLVSTFCLGPDRSRTTRGHREEAGQDLEVHHRHASREAHPRRQAGSSCGGLKRLWQLPRGRYRRATAPEIADGGCTFPDPPHAWYVLMLSGLSFCIDH